MSEIPLNKFEKVQKVTELHKQGKTIRQIASIVRMSFRDISKIIKAYEKKIKLESNKKENNISSQKIKKPSISSLAFQLFRDGTKLTDVAIDLQIPAKQAVKLWVQFLKLERIHECYEFYKLFQYEIPQLLTISSFFRQNTVNITNIANILKETRDIYHLQLYRTRIANEIERLKNVIKNRDYEIKPLPNINWNYPLDSRYWYFR